MSALISAFDEWTHQPGNFPSQFLNRNVIEMSCLFVLFYHSLTHSGLTYYMSVNVIHLLIWNFWEISLFQQSQLMFKYWQSKTGKLTGITVFRSGVQWGYVKQIPFLVWKPDIRTYLIPNWFRQYSSQYKSAFLYLFLLLLGFHLSQNESHCKKKCSSILLVSIRNCTSLQLPKW